MKDIKKLSDKVKLVINENEGINRREDQLQKKVDDKNDEHLHLTKKL